MIEIRQLTKVFHPARSFGAWLRAPWGRGQPITALRDVSLTIERGELICLMGPNGAGKTTLLNLLVDLLLPTSGTVLIDGRDIRRHARWVKSQVGFASSDRPGFYDRLTGRQNLEFFAALYGLPRLAARRRIDELAELLGLEALDRQYQECSAGMKQRLLLARTLLHDPPILLLDEPTKSLDPVQTDIFHTLIRERLHRDLRKTTLFTTHQVWEAQRLAQTVAVLHHGILRGRGTPAELQQAGDFDSAIRQLCQ